MFRRCVDTITIFTNPSARAGYDTRSIFKRSLTGLNSEFFFSYTSCLTKTEDPSLPYYLPIAGGRIFGFIPFPRVLVLCEMQSVRSRIWTRVAVSTSCDDNHYTTGTSIVDTITERIVTVLNKFTVLCQSSYFGVYFSELKFILSCNWVVYSYTRIFLILLPHPVCQNFYNEIWFFWLSNIFGQMSLSLL